MAKKETGIGNNDDLEMNKTTHNSEESEGKKRVTG